MNKLKPLAAFTSIAVLCSAALTACHSTSSPHPYWTMRNTDARCSAPGGFGEGCGKGTPEIWGDDKEEHFRVHYVEFDDQGWLYTGSAEQGKPQNPSKTRTQIDLAMEDLARTLEKGRKVRLVVFAHGWKHNADPRDRDVVRFRELLAQFDATRDTIMRGNDNTELIGIYIGWRGRSWETNNYASNLLLNLTFWSRKSAAIRVAQGEVRELFARVRGLQEFYNGDRANKCGAETEPPDCLRTIMIGHSFGAWVTYAAVAQSLVEVLSIDRDVPDARKQADGSAEPIKRGRARLADLILLVNPAFEAVRYAAVHETALRRELANHYEPPLLVSITSTGDRATKTAFPAGRYINSLLEYNTSSLQKEAMIRTPGHMEAYQTHRLDKLDQLTEEERKGVVVAECAGWQETGVELQQDNWGRHFMTKPEFAKDPDRLRAQLLANAKAERAARSTYFENASWMTGAPRHMCGGLVLMRSSNAEKQEFPVHLPIWNITTLEHVIPDHSNFMTPAFFNFVKQLYSDRLRAAAGPK